MKDENVVVVVNNEDELNRISEGTINVGIENDPPSNKYILNVVPKPKHHEKVPVHGFHGWFYIAISPIISLFLVRTRVKSPSKKTITLQIEGCYKKTSTFSLNF